MKLSSELRAFEDRLGYTFKYPELLIEAITHSSVNSNSRRDNQRLEFLGDRVLGLVISDALLREYEDAREGLLAPRYNALVRKECCAEVALEIDIGSILTLGRSEILSGGRRKKALLGDAIEAVIAAVFLDGGFEAARSVVLCHWQKKIISVKTQATDPKTELQEWAQSCGYPPPDYLLISRVGPDHEPIFMIEARVQNGLSVTSRAGNKRDAEKAAASALLEQIREREE